MIYGAIDTVHLWVLIHSAATSSVFLPPLKTHKGAQTPPAVATRLSHFSCYCHGTGFLSQAYHQPLSDGERCEWIRRGCLDVLEFFCGSARLFSAKTGGSRLIPDLISDQAWIRVTGKMITLRIQSGPREKV